ncbi:MAG: PepSY-associated TM helix domain-containing protein [Pseudomonadota bacterium]
MQQVTTKRFYEVHSWVGAVTAILIFVIAFTGAVSVFGRPELKIWANEAIHQPQAHEPAAIEALVKERAADVPADYLDEITVLFPAVRSAPNLTVYFQHERETADGKTENHVIRFDHHPQTLELIERSEGEIREVFTTGQKDMADFIITFHADLHLGNPWGLLLTGLLGLTLFASIVTGVITHRKVLREAFTFRPFRSLRLLFTDSHKALGVWGLLFHGTIAFTGAFLGLAVVVLFPAAAFVAVGGDIDALADKFLPLGAPEKSGVAAPITFAEALAEVEETSSGPVVSLNLLASTDENGVALVNTLAGDGIVGYTYRYQTTGTVLEQAYTTFSRVGGAGGPILDAMFPLHFGNFAGTAVKFLWLFLGLSTAFLAVSGMMIWIERRVYGSTGSLAEKTYRRISRMTVGGCAGVVVGFVALFHAQLLLPVPGKAFGFWLGVVFFGVWAASLLWAMLRSNEYRSTKELLFVAAILSVLVAPMNAVVTGNHLANALTHGHLVTAGVDLTMLLAGIAVFAIALRLPSERPVRKGKYGRPAEPQIAQPVLSADAQT